MAGDARQRVASDVAQADVPVAIHPGVVFGLRVVEVYGADVLRPDVAVERLDGRRGAVFVAQVVAGREGVRRVEADAEVEFGAGGDDIPQVLEAVAYAFALPGRVFQEDAERAEF